VTVRPSGTSAPKTRGAPVSGKGYRSGSMLWAILISSDGGEAHLIGRHGLMGEDATELMRGAVRVPVKSRFKITSFGRTCVPGQLPLELSAPLARRLPAGRPSACDEYARGQRHDNS
jgi:hypothetical protein